MRPRRVGIVNSVTRGAQVGRRPIERGEAARAALAHRRDRDHRLEKVEFVLVFRVEVERDELVAGAHGAEDDADIGVRPSHPASDTLKRRPLFRVPVPAGHENPTTVLVFGRHLFARHAGD